MTKSCETCRQYLGGGSCNLSIEMECRDGGGFEAWEYSGKHSPEDPTKARIGAAAAKEQGETTTE